VLDWSKLPPHLRSYINSENEKDIECAEAECERLGLNYHQTRGQILREMVAEYDANEPARARRRKHV
jgi:hypothetical protein